MPQRLYGYIRSSRHFMLRQLAALESGRVRLVKCDQATEVDVSGMAIEMLRQELEKAEDLMMVYGVKEDS